MNKSIDKTRKFSVLNIWNSINQNENYKHKWQYCDDVKKLQKEIFKNNLLPTVENEIKELIKNNYNYSKIEILEIKGKYTKNEKYIDVTLYYNDDREIIIIAKNILNELYREIWTALLQKHNLDVF